MNATSIEEIVAWTVRVNESRSETIPHYHPGLDQILCNGGRSGVKVHSATSGSTVTDCGTWLKAATRHYRLRQSATSVSPKNFCEKCFPNLVR